MAMVKLVGEGRMQYVISQNVDGIHRKSGIHPSKLSELHGNTNLEFCCWCGKEYLRDFDCCHGSAAASHETGRRCSVPGCNGPLLDTIIHFGENLPKEDLEQAYKECGQADLIVCLGSSLTVSPANDLPKKVAQHGGELVIVNLQRTPLDNMSTLRIHGRTDEVMIGVMQELGLEIPPFVLNRLVRVQHSKQSLLVEAIDVDGTPGSLFRTVTVKFLPSGNTQKKKSQLVLGRMETAFSFDRKPDDEASEEVHIGLEFMGHYAEPPLRISYKLEGETGNKRIPISYNPTESTWSVGEPQIDETPAPKPTGPEHWPKEAQDSLHQRTDHLLKLKESVYQGVYRCNKCMLPGTGWVYHCAPCSFDLHPHCCTK